MPPKKSAGSTYKNKKNSGISNWRRERKRQSSSICSIEQLELDVASKRFKSEVQQHRLEMIETAYGSERFESASVGQLKAENLLLRENHDKEIAKLIEQHKKEIILTAKVHEHEL